MRENYSFIADYDKVQIYKKRKDYEKWDLMSKKNSGNRLDKPVFLPKLKRSCVISQERCNVFPTPFIIHIQSHTTQTCDVWNILFN